MCSKVIVTLGATPDNPPIKVSATLIKSFGFRRDVRLEQDVPEYGHKAGKTISVPASWVSTQD